jgi:hypothetical protein
MAVGEAKLNKPLSTVSEVLVSSFAQLTEDQRCHR